jgi:hypothetical protein
MAGNDQAQVRYSMAEQSGGRVTPCAIRIIHVKETRRVGFQFILKNSGDGLSAVWPQNHCDGFLV